MNKRDINKIIKYAIKSIAPPILLDILRKNFREKGFRFDGPYESWDQAALHSIGYDNGDILERVLSATLKVKRGEAAYERDSVTFSYIEYEWPLVAVLMRVAAECGGRLRVMDFGGALGSTYFQNCSFLAGLPEIQWAIVEQEHYVNAGKSYIEDENLKFFYNIESCTKVIRPNVALLSGVLQYVSRPTAVLNEVFACSCKYIVVDRTPFLNMGGNSEIRIQHTPQSISASSYPCWFFDSLEFVEQFESFGYKRVLEFDALDRLSDEASWKGMVFKK